MLPNPEQNSYLMALFGSLCFFLVKGISYSLIGSYIPLLVAAIFLLGLLLAVRSKQVAGLRILRGWGILLIIWGFVRLLIEVLFSLTPGLTENHIREQFSLPDKALSLLALFIGFYLFKQAKSFHQAKTTSA